MDVKIKRISAPECVVEYIKDSIQRGVWKPGDKLPSEPELSKAIGVGRSSLREGMRILAAFGIVEIRQGDGTFITDHSGEQVFDFLGFYPSKKNLKYLQQLRYILEIGCFQIDFPMLQPSDYRQLNTMVDELVKANSLLKMIEADAKFHQFFVDKTENPLIIRIYRMMSKMQGMIFSQLMCYDDVAADAKDSHAEICSSVMEGDYAKGIQAFQKHMRKIEFYAEKYIADDL